jgi:hypothetical protein
MLWIARKRNEPFDEIMDTCRNLASAGSCACNPIIFEPMVICILLAQQKRIRQLELKLDHRFVQKNGEERVG